MSIDFNQPFWNKTYLLYDSRELISGKDTLFFAFRGRYDDGHRFIADMYHKGVRNFVVRQTPKEGKNTFAEADFFEVENPLQCMQQLAAYRRTQFNIPVLGITGSNGKTIVKEWLYTLLSPCYKIVKSPKSYNSQIGVPLSVWEMNSYHNLAIFEAGISRTHEMEALKEIIQPTVGIFTTIGSAHDEGFANREEKVKEKMKLFQQVETLIYHADTTLIHQEAAKLPTTTQHMSWGTSSEAQWQMLSQTKSAYATTVQLRHSSTGKIYDFTIPFADDTSIENAMHCIVFMLWLNRPEAQIQERLQLLRNIPMRLELKEGMLGCQLIDDTYGHDILGLRMALNFLAQHRQNQKATVILSDLQQTGTPDTAVYPQIAQWFKERDIQRIWLVGEKIKAFKRYFEGKEVKDFTHTEEILESLASTIPFQGEIVLVKGARDFRFERITQQLQQKLHGTRLEIDLDAITCNLKFYKSFLKRSTQVIVMVKAFSYGSGSHQVANMLQYQGVEYLAVAYADEGVKLREKGIRLPIMVLNPMPESFGLLMQYQLEPEIYSLNHLHSFLTFLGQQNAEQSLKIHLKLETGMHRLGFTEADLPDLIKQLQAHPAIKVATVFSHLAAADTAEEEVYTRQQIDTFKRMIQVLEKALPYPFLRHLLNSAGIVRYPEAQFDMVRLGIGLYGVEVNKLHPEALQPIGTLKTSISQIKQLKAGDTVGYGRWGKVEQSMRIATIAIGYADGFDRRFSRGVGKVSIQGKLAPVVGNVCMDMTMVDVTQIPEAKEGDEVIIFGKALPVAQVAESIGTIPYEILTNIKERVRRVFFIF